MEVFLLRKGKLLVIQTLQKSFSQMIFMMQKFLEFQLL